MIYDLNPKQKAKQLINMFYDLYPHPKGSDEFYISKQSALICANEILDLSHPYTIVYSEKKNEYLNEYTQQYYWMKVEQHIEEETL